AGLSQNALAKIVSINASYINRMETGEREAPTREVVHALARALALTLEEVDRLHFAAGHVPPSIQKLGAADSTIAAVTRVLTNDRLSPEARADFRAVVETTAVRWQAGQASAIPLREVGAAHELTAARAELAQLKARLAKLARAGGAA